jgi:hypothetical protein
MSPRVELYRSPFRGQHLALRQPYRQESRLAVWAISLSGAGLILMLGPSAFLNAPADTVVWITAGILVAFMIAGWHFAKARGENPWITPVFLIMAQFVLRYGIGAVAAYYWRSVPWEVPSMREAFLSSGVWSNLPLACRLALLGGCGMYLGLHLRPTFVARILPRVDWPISERKIQRNLFICVPLGLLAYTWLSPHIPKGLQFLAEATVNAADGMVLLASYYLFTYRRGRLKWALIVVLLYACMLPTAARSGQMVPVLMPALLVLCGYMVARRSLPWAALVLAAPLAMYVVVPFVAFHKMSKLETPSVQAQVEQAAEAFSKASYETRLELALERTVVRFAGISLPAVFVQYYPWRYPFEMGRTFLIEVTGLVPRVIWKDKPYETELNLYSERVGLFPPGSQTSMIFDSVSEYYLNFGDAGVFLLSILNGWYLSLLYTWLVRLGNPVIGPAIFLALLAGNWDCFGVVLIASGQIRFLPIWIVIFYVMSYKRNAYR